MKMAEIGLGRVAGEHPSPFWSVNGSHGDLIHLIYSSNSLQCKTARNLMKPMDSFIHSFLAWYNHWRVWTRENSQICLPYSSFVTLAFPRPLPHLRNPGSATEPCSNPIITCCSCCSAVAWCINYYWQTTTQKFCILWKFHTPRAAVPEPV